MRKLVLYGFPYALKTIFGIAAVVLAILAVTNQANTASYAFFAVVFACVSWFCPTLGRPVSAQEIYDGCPVDKMLKRDVSSEELDHALRRQLARALMDGNDAKAEEIVKTYKLWKDLGAPSLSGIRPSALK